MKNLLIGNSCRANKKPTGAFLYPVSQRKGFTAIARGQDEHRSRGVLVIITEVADSVDYVVDIGPSTFTHPSGAGATNTSIRDGLIALIDAGSEPVSVESDGDDRLLISFDDPDNIPAIEVGVRLAQKKRVEVIGLRDVTFSVDVMVDPKVQAAVVLLEQLRGSLENPQFCEIIQMGGWSIGPIEGSRKGDAVISAEWQGRAGFDLRLSCRSLSLGAIDYIEDAEINSGLPGGP